MGFLLGWTLNSWTKRQQPKSKPYLDIQIPVYKRTNAAGAMAAMANYLVNMEINEKCYCMQMMEVLNSLDDSEKDLIDDVFDVTTDNHTYTIVWYEGHYGFKHIVSIKDALITDALVCVRRSYEPA